VVIGAIELRLREPLDQPPEQGLVADVHSQCDLRLPAVPAERPLPDQQPHEDATV
jgi:hypothetical protein